MRQGIASVRKQPRILGVAHFADVDVAARIDREAVRRDEFPGLESRSRLASEPRDELALAIHDRQAGPDVRVVPVHRRRRTELADDESGLAAAAAVEAAGPVHVDPLRFVLAVAVEHLDAVILAVGDVHPALRVGGDVVRDVELAGIRARLAPREQQLSVRRVLVHARIAVAVAHVDLAPGRQRRVRAAVERQAAHVGRRLPGDADLEQHLAVGRALAHEVAGVVGAIQDVVGVDVQPVGAREGPFSPRGQEVAVRVEDDHRVLAAVEHEHPIPAVDRNRGDVLQLPPFGQLRPVLHHAVAVLAAPQDRCHRISSVFLRRRRRVVGCHRTQ